MGLFQGRYKAIPVDPEELSYAVTVADYIHLNPVRARMAGSQEELRRFPWCSHRWYAGERSGRPGWLTMDRILWEVAAGEGGARVVRRYREYVERRIEEERTRMEGRRGREADENPWQQVRRGWVLGAEEFRDKVVQLAVRTAAGARRDSHVRKGALACHDEAAAERMMVQGMRTLGLKGGDMGTLRKNDGRKQALAWWLRKRTTVTSAWVAGRLEMGHISNIGRAVAAVESGSNLLARRSQKKLIRYKD